MRAYLLLLFAVVASPFAASRMPGPEPPPVRVTPPTPESIQAEIAAAAKERQYAFAAAAASRAFRLHGCSDQFSDEVGRSAIDNHVPVRIIVALIVVESTCRPGVVSSRGAIGLMQVMPNVWHVQRDELFDPEFNIQKGTEILAAYTKAHGLREGLHRYNGTGVGCSTCDPEYADKVYLMAGYRVQ